MEDRSVQYPQRYQLKKVEGTDDIYDLVPAPGEITAEGTLINKSALLKDETAAFFKDLPENPVPDDVLKILSKAALVGEDGNIQTPGGVKVQNVKMVAGYYTGTGVSGPITISLPFEPSMFVLGQDNGTSDYSGLVPMDRSWFLSFFWYSGIDRVDVNDGVVKIDSGENFIKVTGQDTQPGNNFNYSGYTYRYLAFGE